MTSAQDLELAQACAGDDPQSWETFVSLYRSRLYQAAQAIAKDQALASDIADSLWAELYGTRVDSSGHRISKLASYAGRGSLEGWLRALVAQEYVNRVRRQRRLTTLDQQVPELSNGAVEKNESVDPQLDHALGAALSELKTEQRLLLAAYYLDGRSLGEIGRMMGLHESTVSRRLKKSLQVVRKRTIHHLRRGGMTMRQAEETVSGDLLTTSLDLQECLAANRC
jgi:RNA polymerase sigma-70 factor (ECF subfamily)